MAHLASVEASWPVPILWPNSRAHRMQVYSRQRAAKDEAFWATRAVVPPGYRYKGESKLKLTIHAHPPTTRTRDDDGLIGACKAYRDGIALALIIDDTRFQVQPVIWHANDKRGRVVFDVDEEG